VRDDDDDVLTTMCVCVCSESARASWTMDASCDAYTYLDQGHGAMLVVVEGPAFQKITLSAKVLCIPRSEHFSMLYRHPQSSSDKERREEHIKEAALGICACPHVILRVNIGVCVCAHARPRVCFCACAAGRLGMRGVAGRNEGDVKQERQLLRQGRLRGRRRLPSLHRRGQRQAGGWRPFVM
jgi:hypothetical protein